jgi:hypothetical protein
LKLHNRAWTLWHHNTSRVTPPDSGDQRDARPSPDTTKQTCARRRATRVSPLSLEPSPRISSRTCTEKGEFMC